MDQSPLPGVPPRPATGAGGWGFGRGLRGSFSSRLAAFIANVATITALRIMSLA
jgi:hypothetical protein